MSHGHHHHAPRQRRPILGAIDASLAFNIKYAQWSLPVSVIDHDDTRTTLGISVGSMVQRVLVPKAMDQISHGSVVLHVRGWLARFGNDAVIQCRNPGCGAPTWNHNHFRCEALDGRCEDCRLKGWSKRVDAVQHDRVAKNRLEDPAAKAMGYTHKTTAWVHPPTGDAYMLIWHTVSPMLASAVRAVLRHEGSTDLTDFTIKEL